MLVRQVRPTCCTNMFEKRTIRLWVQIHYGMLDQHVDLTFFWTIPCCANMLVQQVGPICCTNLLDQHSTLWWTFIHYKMLVQHVGTTSHSHNIPQWICTLSLNFDFNPIFLFNIAFLFSFVRLLIQFPAFPGFQGIQTSISWFSKNEKANQNGNSRSGLIFFSETEIPGNGKVSGIWPSLIPGKSGIILTPKWINDGLYI